MIHTDLFVPRSCNSNTDPDPDVQGAQVKDRSWMERSSRILKQDHIQKGDIITWSEYKSMLGSKDSMKPPAETGIYSLLQENAASASPMKHATELVMENNGFFLTQARLAFLVQTNHCMPLSNSSRSNTLTHWSKMKFVAVMDGLYIDNEMHAMAGNYYFDQGGSPSFIKLWSLLLTWFNFNPSMDK